MAITKISPYEMGDYHSFGQNVGKSFGAGINHAVSGLAQAKLNTLLAKQQKQDQWHEREQAYTQAVAGGLSPEDARIVASAAPEDRINYWKILAGSRRSPEAGQNPMSSEMGGPQQQEQQSLQQLLQQGGQQGNGQDAVMQNLMKLLGGQQGQQMMQQSQSPQQVNQMLQPNAQTSQQGQMTTAEKFAGYETPQIRAQREENEKNRALKERLFDRSEATAEQKEINKENSKFNEELAAKTESTLRINGVIDAMEALDENNELNHPAFLAGLEKIGLDYEFLKKPGSSEFNKLRNEFFARLRPLFGNRILATEIGLFMQGIPSLSQTKEGRARIFRNLRLMNDADDVFNEARLKLIDDNGGKQPRGLRDKALKAARPKLEEIYGQLKEGLKPKIHVGAKLGKLPNVKDVEPGTRIYHSGSNTTFERIGSSTKWKKYKGRAKD